MDNQKQKEIPDVDLVLWGATSFVGRLTAAYLWPRYGADGAVRMALGGRDAAALEAVRRDLNADETLPIVVGDAFDKNFMDSLTRKTRLVVSTVGPYARYGAEMVAACAANGTDYCDLAGEAQWMHQMIHAHQQTAEASGARIVHACGFDSVPSDIGVLFLQNEAMRRFGHPMSRVRLLVKAMRGGLSGGTFASILKFIEDIRKDPEVAKIAKNPYALVPAERRPDARQPSVSAFGYDTDAKTWIGPFLMAAVNTRVVHRSNFLRDFSWGRDFVYDEAVMTGRGVAGSFKAGAVSLGLGAMALGGAFAPTRGIMRTFLLPKPGQGPSPEEQENGFYNLRLFGSDSDGNRLRVTVKGDRDPGYGSTSKMLGESAVCLLTDVDRQTVKGGFWTPSTAMGTALLDRLTANAGLSFTAEG